MQTTKHGDHNVMLLVLASLAQSGPAKSGEIAEALSFISRGYASLILRRCYLRGFASREPYKCGSERGFIYELASKGADWIFYKSRQWEHARNSVAEPGKEDIPLPCVRCRDSMSMETMILLPIVYSLLRKNRRLRQRCDSLEEAIDVTLAALLVVTSDRNVAAYAYFEERRKRLDTKSTQKKDYEPAPRHEHSQITQYGNLSERRIERAFIKGLSQGRKEGLQIGKILGQVEAYGEATSKTASALVKRSFLRIQKYNAVQAAPNYHDAINRWWRYLHPSYNSPPLPVRGPARG